MEVLQIVENNKRLDQIVVNYYGDLSMFDRVIAENTHLTNIILTIGDSVNLPEKTKQKIEEKLW